MTTRSVNVEFTVVFVICLNHVAFHSVITSQRWFRALVVAGRPRWYSVLIE